MPEVQSIVLRKVEVPGHAVACPASGWVGQIVQEEKGVSDTADEFRRSSAAYILQAASGRNACWLHGRKWGWPLVQVICIERPSL